MGFIVFKKLTLEDAVKTMKAVETWFAQHPRKRKCKTDLFEIRRGFTATDVLEHTDLISIKP